MSEKIWFDDAWEDSLCWQTRDKKTLKHTNQLIKDIKRSGCMKGIGKSEPLTGGLQGGYSEGSTTKTAWFITWKTDISILLTAEAAMAINKPLCPAHQGGIFCSAIGNSVEFPMAQKRSAGSHCGGLKDVAEATRRRRRIPQAGFFFIYQNLSKSSCVVISRSVGQSFFSPHIRLGVHSPKFHDLRQHLSKRKSCRCFALIIQRISPVVRISKRRWNFENPEKPFPEKRETRI